MMTGLLLARCLVTALCVLGHSGLHVSADNTSALVTRSEWGSAYPRGGSYISGKVGQVFIQHTVNPPVCYSLSNCSSAVREVQRYHVEDRGWDDIGYSFLVGQDGRVYEGRGWNRTGAHTYGYNTKSYGIAFIGNFETAVPTDLSLNAVKNFLDNAGDWLTHDYIIRGHRDVRETASPGKNLYNIIITWPRYGVPEDMRPNNSALVTRSEWGSAYPRGGSYISGKLGQVFIHHTATPACYSQSACSSAIKGIQSYHVNDRGWDDIGYSFLVGQDGRVYEGRGWNRTGAHTYGYNSKSYGIAILGNFEAVAPNDLSLNAVKNFLDNAGDWLTDDFIIRAHKDVRATLCPGDVLYNIIKAWPRYRFPEDMKSDANTSALVTRSQWGSAYPRGGSYISGKLGQVFIHHTATPACDSFSTCSNEIKGFQRYHVEDRGWDDIGYSFLVGQDGRVYEGRGWNRTGAHTYRYNSKSYGIAIIGNFETVAPNDLSLNAVKNFLDNAGDWLTDDYIIRGHRDVRATLCPGDVLYNIIKTWPRYGVPGDKKPNNSALVTRSEWGSAYPRGGSYISGKVGQVFIQHTLNPPVCYSLSNCSSAVREVQRYHVEDRGWDDIGYSFLVGQDGRVYEGRGWNRTGAHTYGYNSKSYGIAFIGNFETAVPNNISLDALKNFLDNAGDWLTDDYIIRGHRDVRETASPGKNLYNIIKTWPHYAVPEDMKPDPMVDSGVQRMIPCMLLQNVIIMLNMLWGVYLQNILP